MSETRYRVPRTDIDWSRQDMDDNVMGSGAVQYAPWISDITLETTGHGLEFYRFEMVAKGEDPDDRVNNLHHFDRSRDDVARAIEAIVDGEYNINDTIVRYFKDDNLDCWAVEVLAQVLCYGEVIYG